MKSLGVFGIYREAYEIVLSRRKIFTQIILFLILPLFFISLAHTYISNTLFPKSTQVPTSNYTNIFDLLSSKPSSYWVLWAAYTIFSFIFSLLSTSAIVYTVACVYSDRDVTLRMVMSVLPKVWKRLMVTSIICFLALCTYHLVTFLVLALVSLLIAFSPYTNAGFVILLVVAVLYAMGFLYMIIVWQLAGTISVLENSYGFKALKRSNRLIRGKMGMSSFIFSKLGLLHYMLLKALEKVVVHGQSQGMVNRVAYADVCLSLLLLMSLFECVIQTIIYFVCKSHHNEPIDKFALSDHLQVFSTPEYYVPLKGDNLQSNQFYLG